MTEKVKLVAKTQPVIEGVNTPEELVAYAARVSNPSNQLNSATADKLLGYCWRHKHYSIFETASLTMEINTTRGIAPQILRHRSFTFQEFSLRYSKALDFEDIEFRAQDTKNRQASHDTLEPKLKNYLEQESEFLMSSIQDFYDKLISNEVAKECARGILPMCTKTRLYMTGNIRSWIFYCITRCEIGTQKEHRDIANECWKILRKECPNIAKFVEEEYSYMKDIK